MYYLNFPSWNFTYFYLGEGLDDLEYDELGINWTQEFASYPSIEDSMYDSTYSSAASTSSGMSWKKFGVPRFFFSSKLTIRAGSLYRVYKVPSQLLVCRMWDLWRFLNNSSLILNESVWPLDHLRSIWNHSKPSLKHETPLYGSTVHTTASQ